MVSYSFSDAEDGKTITSDPLDGGSTAASGRIPNWDREATSMRESCVRVTSSTEQESRLTRLTCESDIEMLFEPHELLIEPNYDALFSSVEKGEIVGLVDNHQAGIVAYVLKPHAGRLINMLNAASTEPSLEHEIEEMLRGIADAEIAYKTPAHRELESRVSTLLKNLLAKIGKTV